MRRPLRSPDTDPRSTTALDRKPRPGKDSPRRLRGARPPWQDFHAGFDRLEDRTLLATTLTSAQISALNSGLPVLAAWTSDLNGYSLLNQQLPGIDRAINQLIDVGSTVSSQLTGPALSYLSANGSNSTAEGLAAAYGTQSDAGTVTGSVSNNVLTFTVPNFNASATTPNLALDLGANAQLLGLNATGSATVPATGKVHLDLSFGVDANGNFFIDPSSTDPFTFTASVDATLPNFNLDVGFLQASVQNGSANLTATASASFSASGNITQSQLSGSEGNLGSLVTLSATSGSNLAVTLPVSASLGGTSLTGSNATIALADSDPFHGTAPTVSTSNLGSLLDFTDLSATQVLSDLSQLGGWFNRFRNTSLFNTAIPFGGGQTLGSVLDLGTAYDNTLLNGLESVVNPIVGATVAPTGGGSTGGNLAAGKYVVQYTLVNSNGESAPSPTSGTFTITAGQIPQVTLPQAPASDTINLYLSDTSATAGSETLYATGITSTTYDLSAAAAANQPNPPGPSTASPSFVTAQDLLSVLASTLGLGTATINAQYDSTADVITYTVQFQDNLPSLTAPLNFDLNLGALGQVTTAAQLQIAPTATISFTFGENLAPTPAVLAGVPSSPIPASGSFPPSNFSLVVGDNAPVAVSTGTINYTSINGTGDSTSLVAQLNQVLQNTSLGTSVVAGFANNKVRLTLQDFTRGRTLQIVDLGSSDPLNTVLGFVNGQPAHAGSGGLSLSNASAVGGIALTVVNTSANQSFASAMFGPLQIAIGQGAITGNASVTASLAGNVPISLSTLTSDLGSITSLVPSLTPSGSLTATFDKISVAGTILSTLTGDPTFTITIPDITKPTDVTTSETDFGSLLNFQDLSVGTIFSGLQSAVGALSTYSDFGFLADPLPVINKSIVDLVDYGAGLAAAVTGLENNQPSALQGLNNAIDAALGLPPGSNLVNVSYDTTNTALEVKLQYDPSYDQTLPLNLDLATLAALAGGQASSFLQGVSQLIDVSGSSNLHVHAGASVTLDLGIGLSDPLHPSPFLYSDTGASLSLLLAATNIHFNASIGPLGVAISGGTAAISSDGKSTTQAASFTVGLNPKDGNNTGQPTLTEFLGDLKNEVTTTLTAGAGLNLPLSIISPAAPLGTLAIAIPDLNALFEGTTGSVTITTPDIASQLKQLFSVNNLLSNPTVFLNGFDSLLGHLQSALNSQVLQTNLPLIGTHLGDAAQFIQGFRTNVIQSLENDLNSAAPNGDLTQIVTNGLDSVFGPSGLNILDGSVTKTSPDSSSVQFNMHLHQDLVAATVPINFDIGLPGLGLKVNGKVQLMIGWDFYLDFGLSSSEGLYLVTNPTDSQGNAVPVFKIAIDASIPGLTAQGNLFFLQLNVNDNANNPTDLNGAFTVNLSSPSSDHHLTVPQLFAGPLSSIVSPVLTATADVNLHLVASVGGNAAFPSFSTDFALAWDFSSQTGLSGDTPQVSLDNVTLDFGTFLSNFVGPIFQKIDTVLDPVKPVIKILTSPIPVISDLAGQPITLIDIAENLEPSLKPGIDAFLSVYNLYITLDSEVQNIGSGSLTINLGSFNLNDAVKDFSSLINSVNALQTASLDTSKLPSPADLAKQLNLEPNSSAAQQFVSNVSATGGSISFPILSDPASVLQLFLGQTVNLFTFDTPTFTLGFTYTAMFEIFGPLFAELTGSASATLHFTFGYDTYGIQEFSDTGYSPSALPDLLDGFYVVAGQPNVILNAGISAGAELNIGIADAGVAGGIYATVTMSLADLYHTGKLRISQLGEEILTMPQCLFNVSGEVYAQLTWFVDVNLFLFSIHESGAITPPIVLFSFDYSCPPPTPVLATEINGVLYLNMGPRAADRVNGNLSSTNEQFAVRHDSGSAGNETVDVSAFGATQTYSGVKAIVADAGTGNETIDCSTVESPTYLTPGQGSDKLIGGSGTNTVIATASTISSASAPFSGDMATALSQEEPAPLSTTSFNLSNGSLAIGSVGTDTLSGIQNVILVGASSPTTFNVSNWGGSDTLIGEASGNTYNVQMGGGGTTTIVAAPPGGNGKDQATITGSTTNAPITISATSTSQQNGDVVNYNSNLASLTVDGGAGDTTYNILGTLGGSSTTTLNTGDGNDTVNVQATGGSTTINPGAGTDTINVGSLEPNAGGNLASIQGALVVAGGRGSDTLNLDDTGDTSPRTNTLLTATSLTGLGMGPSGIAYSGLAALNLDLGTGGDTINTQGTASGTATTIQASTRGGVNTINVGSNEPNSGGNLAGIQGPLTVQGNGKDTLNLDDTGNATGQSATLAATTLAGLDLGSSPLTYGGLAALNLYLGKGGDTINTQGTAAATTTTIDAPQGGSSNTFNVGSTAGTVPTSPGIVDKIQGPLVIVGGGSDTMNVDDTGSTGPKTGPKGGNLTESALTGLGMGSQGIAYSGLSALNINLGSGGNQFAISVSAGNNLPSTTMINGGTSNSDSLTATWAGDFNDTLDLLAFESSQITIKGDLNGTMSDTLPGDVQQIAVTGSVTSSGSLLAGSIGTMTVGKDIAGKVTSQSFITSLTVGASAYHGSVTGTGLVSAVTDITAMQVYGNVAGNVTAGGQIGTMTVGSSSYAGSVSGLVKAGTNIGTAQVYGDVSGAIKAGGTIGSLTIGSSSYAGSVIVTGLVSAGQNITQMLVYGNVAGTVNAGVDITTMQVDGNISGTVQAGHTIGSLTVGTPTYPGSVTATGLVSAGQDIVTMLVYGNVAGIVQAGATIHTMTVDGSVIPTLVSGQLTAGIIRAASINTLSVVGAMAGQVDATANLQNMSVGQDVSGLIDVGQALGLLTVGGGTPGSIIAGTIDRVATSGGYGPVVAQIMEGGVQRRIEAAVPQTPYPQPIPLYTYPTSAPLDALPASVNFQYYYEGLGSNNGSLTNPQATIRVTNNSGNRGPDQYDLSLVTWSDTAQFNLARLDATTNVNGGVSGIRNVAIEGNLLPAVTQEAQGFFQPSSAQGGVRLPQDQLAGVEVRDNAQAGEVTAASIQGLAFGSLTGTSSTGTIITQTGAVSNQAYASQLLNSGTAIVQAGTVNSQHQETFRVPFDDQPSQSVALFQSDSKNAGLDNDPIMFDDEDQGISTGDPRGTVTALVSLNGPALTGSNFSIIQAIDLYGDGGSFSTKLPVAARVTSTGPLGDLSFLATQGITANVTAPSIIGNISASGPIAGIIQTTGIWTNMTTGKSSTIPADFGRAITDSKGNILSVTTVSAQGGGISGELVSRGNLNSQITANSGISGVIAAQGDLGVIQRNSGGQLVRFGGIQSNGTISGQVVTLGNILADINITGNLTGRIAANGRALSSGLGLPSSATGILGNITIGNSMGTGTTTATQGAIVSRGEIGDPTLGTALNLSQAGAVNGILAAEGAIRSSVSPTSTFFSFSNVPDVPGNPNAVAIDAIFETLSGSTITSFDDPGTLDLANLNQILTDLARLHVIKNSSGQYVLSDS